MTSKRFIILIIVANVIMAFFIIAATQLIFMGLAHAYVRVTEVTPLTITTDIIPSPNGTAIPTVTQPNFPNYPFLLFLGLLIMNIAFAIVTKRTKEGLVDSS